MSVIFSLIIAFAIGFSSAPMNATEQPVTASATVQQVESVDPILAQDAAATLEDHGIAATFDADGNTFAAVYVESSPSSDSMFNEFTLESTDFPGTFHHFVYQQQHDA